MNLRRSKALSRPAISRGGRRRTMIDKIASSAPDAAAAGEELRSYVRRVVVLHHAMLDRLLFGESELGPELAELFEDAGHAYIEFSAMISELNAARELAGH